MHQLALLQSAPQAPNPMYTWGFMGFMVILFYFIAWRPAQKQRKQQEEMRASIQGGDRVRMSGGMYGTVVRTKDDRVVVRIATGVEVEFARAAVAEVITAKDA